MKRKVCYKSLLQAAVISADVAASAPAVSASDSYGAAAAFPQTSVAASDSYGVVDASSDSWPAAASEDSFALASSQSFEPSSYSAVSSEPVITDNSVAAAGDSYGSPRGPAPSSYDALDVPSLAGKLYYA